VAPGVARGGAGQALVAPGVALGGAGWRRAWRWVAPGRRWWRRAGAGGGFLRSRLAGPDM